MTIVGEACRCTVSIAHAHEPVLEIAHRMRDHHVGCLIVVEEAPRGRIPVGVVTDRDLVLGVLATRLHAAERIAVNEVMSQNVVSVRQDATLIDALALKRGEGVRRVPVVDDGGVLLGLLALDDVLCLLAEQLQDVVGLLRREEHSERARTVVSATSQPTP